MQQRAALARTLAADPDILLMDEPFGALDAQTRRIMQEELLAIWRQTRKTVVFVTHDVAEAVYLADTISVMSARPGPDPPDHRGRLQSRRRSRRVQAPGVHRTGGAYLGDWCAPRWTRRAGSDARMMRDGGPLRAAADPGGAVGGGDAARNRAAQLLPPLSTVFAAFAGHAARRHVAGQRARNRSCAAPPGWRRRSWSGSCWAPAWRCGRGSMPWRGRWCRRSIRCRRPRWCRW